MLPAAIVLCCAVGLTACGERAEQKAFPLSECRDKLLADIGKNYPNARVIYEVFEDHTNTEGPVKIYDEVARVPVTIVDPEHPKEMRHSLIVSASRICERQSWGKRQFRFSVRSSGY